jgi:UDP-2-acetamido-2,6-beta-L-arabino-hexul-4-ose reductase
LVELFKLDDGGAGDIFGAFFGNEAKHQITMFSVEPGMKRAGHKHPKTNEKWVFVRGQGVARLEYPNGDKLELEIETTDGFSAIDLPAGVGHEIENTHLTEPLWCVYWADRWYDPDDLDVEPWEWK